MDFAARMLSQELQKRWNKTVIVENKPGAGALIGAEIVGRAAPDGTTLLVAPDSMSSNPHLYKVAWDSSRDFAAVISFKEYPPAAIPGMLDAVLRLPYEIVVAEAFSFVERQIGLERISLSLRRLKSDARTRSIPVIFVTGLSSEEEEARGLELGVGIDEKAKFLLDRGGLRRRRLDGGAGPRPAPRDRADRPGPDASGNSRNRGVQNNSSELSNAHHHAHGKRFRDR